MIGSSETGGMAVSPEPTRDAIAELQSAVGESLMLDDQQFRRFTAVVALHTYADRLLSLLVADGIATTEIRADDTKADRLFDAIADLPFGRRLEIAEALSLLSQESAAGLKKINAVRNALIHGKARKGRLFSIGTIPEIATHEPFRNMLLPVTSAVLTILERFAPKDIE
jgi:hypothetical protein